MDAAAQTARPAGRSALFEDLYSKSGGRPLGLSLADFCACLEQICAKYLPAESTDDDISKFCSSLRLEELALARACAAGHEAAWTEFLNRYRAPLYQAGYAIAHDEATGRDLADSLYAELYGLKSGADGQPRASKLSSYTGRGSLEGWLRAVLAQDYVDRYRRQRRLVSLEEQTEAGVQFTAPAPAAAVSNTDSRLTRATDEALAALDSESRYLLAAYFLDGLTLAQIGRTLGAHESTISRKLERVTAALRKQILRALRQTGMSPRAAEEALDIDVRDLAVNVRERLRPPPAENRGTEVEER
jgi:RNA polymerase sigma-70 factor (ECF subfamily)